MVYVVVYYDFDGEDVTTCVEKVFRTEILAKKYISEQKYQDYYEIFPTEFVS